MLAGRAGHIYRSPHVPSHSPLKKPRQEYLKYVPGVKTGEKPKIKTLSYRWATKRPEGGNVRLRLDKRRLPADGRISQSMVGREKKSRGGNALVSEAFRRLGCPPSESSPASDAKSCKQDQV
jgi:hypothetical protein